MRIALYSRETGAPVTLNRIAQGAEQRMTFRKKAIVVAAEQFFSDSKPLPDGMYFEDGEYWVMTIEGPLRVSPGDWIITGVNGEKYPCKPDIFKQTYEPELRLD
ncbi:MAG TPA: hypothetical protein VN517_19470 [Terriglobales bacterium]|nr:hypothetical protein [Terriglobales bacterium]